ncbi:hydroxyphenylacetyl-CoA thioesterase PaaI [Streptomyces sp. NPDC002896]|uniref:hydroxyphenylacetyl-CoA thioesterase PaaI n=1 Tax=Streptomyces sp. NPDC002896 TaxID=3154438 RepID=UPI0033263039
MLVSQEPVNDSLAARVAVHLMDGDACAQAHGIRVEEVADGYARMVMTVRPDMLNSHGICHGGMTYLLADTALAYAANAGNHVTVSTSATISYPAPAKPGDVLTAEARAAHQGHRSGVYDVDVRTQDGTLVALYRGHSRRIGGPVLPQDPA